MRDLAFRFTSAIFPHNYKLLAQLLYKTLCRINILENLWIVITHYASDNSAMTSIVKNRLKNDRSLHLPDDQIISCLSYGLHLAIGDPLIFMPKPNEAIRHLHDIDKTFVDLAKLLVVFKYICLALGMHFITHVLSVDTRWNSVHGMVYEQLKT